MDMGCEKRPKTQEARGCPAGLGRCRVFHLRSDGKPFNEEVVMVWKDVLGYQVENEGDRKRGSREHSVGRHLRWSKQEESLECAAHIPLSVWVSQPLEQRGEHCRPSTYTLMEWISYMILVNRERNGWVKIHLENGLADRVWGKWRGKQGPPLHI